VSILTEKRVYIKHASVPLSRSFFLGFVMETAVMIDGAFYLCVYFAKAARTGLSVSVKIMWGRPTVQPPHGIASFIMLWVF